MRIGTARNGDAFAFEVGDGFDVVGFGDKRGPFRPGEDIDRFDRVAVDFSDKGGGTGG